MLPASDKRVLVGEIALQEARAARHRFEDDKFSLQAKLVRAWQTAK